MLRVLNPCNSEVDSMDRPEYQFDDDDTELSEKLALPASKILQVACMFGVNSIQFQSMFDPLMCCGAFHIKNRSGGTELSVIYFPSANTVPAERHVANKHQARALAEFLDQNPSRDASRNASDNYAGAIRGAKSGNIYSFAGQDAMVNEAICIMYALHMGEFATIGEAEEFARRMHNDFFQPLVRYAAECALRAAF